MSGIYIKGMEFPQEHLVYDFYPNGEVWEQNWQGDSTLVGKAIPVADVAEIVRCGSCKYLHGTDYCAAWNRKISTLAGFCFKGRRA